MTRASMPLDELLGELGDRDKDTLRVVLERTVQALVEAEVTAVIGAGRHERAEERLTYRNGHRLNRGGDRQANNALWHIVMVRLASHQPTKDYMARRTREGLSKQEIIRCLKRYVAREVYRGSFPAANSYRRLDKP
jgi:transposase